MKRAGPYLLVLALFVAGLVAAILDWPLFYTTVVDPIARILWLVERVFLVLDQQVYWILLLFAGFILGALMIPNRTESYHRSANPQPLPIENRVAHWEALLRSAETEADARLSLQLSLQNLQNSIRALVDMDESGEILLPPPRRSLGLGKFSQKKWMRSVEPILVSMETAMEMPDDQSNELYDR